MTQFRDTATEGRLNMNWKEAEEWLYEIREAYIETGFAGSFALTLTINPLVKRFEDGERTQELFDEIMELG